MEQFTDNKLEKLKILTKSIISESERQISKWGIQTHSLFEWCNYTTEELGELAKAISENQYKRGGHLEEIYSEAIQVATLSLKIAEMVLVKH